MDSRSIEYTLAELLKKLGLSLATAESCTGGLLSHRITNVPGSSAFFLGGIVSYAYSAKTRLLGVKQETLELHGAVSRQAVLEMAQGARQTLGADLGIAISGVAGPDGGTVEKPVGFTWIGLCSEDVLEAWNYTWAGGREQVKEQSAQQALQLLVEYTRALEKRQNVTAHSAAVTVTAVFEPDGDARPVEFTLNNRVYKVSAVGRRWRDAAGQHFLVMDQAERLHELVFMAGKGQWRLLEARKFPGVV